MKTNQLIIAIIVSIALFSNILNAQEKTEDPVEGSQFTFVYPLGTNGTDAISKSNNFSVNVLFGVNGGLNGVEFGGLANYNHGEVQGAQFAGIANINREKTYGVMWSGCFNLALDDVQGAQFSELNLAMGDFNGFQAGVINYAGSLRGVQLGIINIVGRDNGAVPIGLINVVKGGYYSLELVASELLYTNVNYKMGVEHFYTIFKMGSSRYENDAVYSFGLGFGTMLTLAEKHKISMDLSFNNIVYNEEWNTDENYLTKFDFAYRYSLGEHFSVLAGPSLNLYSSDMFQDDGVRNLNIPSHAHSFTCDEYQNWVWLGFNAGISYTF